jgi:hypothetical protein
MSGENLTWFSDPLPATEEQITAVESMLKRRLPEDYREFAKRFSGGWPNECDFEICDGTGGIFHASLGEFFTLLPKHEKNLVTWMQRTEFFPAELVPFGVDGGGNYICFDYRSLNDPAVAFWHSGRRGLNDEISFVAKAFSDFVMMLHQPGDKI